MCEGLLMHRAPYSLFFPNLALFSNECKVKYITLRINTFIITVSILILCFSTSAGLAASGNQAIQNPYFTTLSPVICVALIAFTISPPTAVGRKLLKKYPIKVSVTA